MHHAAKKKLRARIWLCVTLLLVSGAHYFLYRFSIDRLNTFPVTEGLAFGCVLWTTVLLGAMWLRQAWARYAMIVMICLALAGFSLAGLLIRAQSVNPLPELMRLLVIGMVLYAVALIPLGASRALRQYLAPRTAGER
jgi:hypothetical protein